VFSAGDLLVGGRPGYLFQGGTAYIENYGSSGVFQQHAALIDGGHPRDMIMVGSDVLVADQTLVTRLSPDGTLTPAFPVFFEALARALSADIQGNIYVGEALGVARIFKISPSGTVLGRFSIPLEQFTISTMDLEPDQCTMLYASGGQHVQRYDVCTGSALANFAQLPAGTVTVIRILTSGNVLVGSTSGITLFDASGRSLQTYLTRESVLSLGIDSDETKAWVGVSISPSGSRTFLMEKLDLSSGSIVVGPVDIQIPNRPVFSAECLLVAGTLRVAQRSSAMEAVPSLSAPLLLLMLITVAAIALRRLN